MKSDLSTQTLWLNGRFLPLGEACISPLDRGFLYGDGVFTTLRTEWGSPLYLEAHLERLGGALSALRMPFDVRFGWREIIRDLLIRNELFETTASVKVLVSRGVASSPGLPDVVQPTMCVMAQQYVPPTPEAYRTGWRLSTFREGFAPPLALHKTLNYLFYQAARQSAIDAGAQDAIILDREGKVSETSIGSLLVQTDGQWWVPESFDQLSGITVEQVRRIFNERDIRVESCSAGPQELHAAQTIWVLNSLMGIMPVCRVDDRAIPDPAAQEASSLRQELFKQGKSF